MYRNFQQEAFSRAYVHAVAAGAGFKYSDGPLPDDDHVDVTISATGPLGTIRSPKLDLQLKCRLGAPEGDPIAFALGVDDYEGLRQVDYAVPRILVVVFVPPDIGDWTQQTEASLMLRHCGYWLGLQGRSETANAATTTVYLPRANVFSVDALRALMGRVARREAP